MHALAAASAAPALAGTRTSASRVPQTRTQTRGFASAPRVGVTCRAGGGDIRDVPPDRRRRAPRSASDASDAYDSNVYGSDARYGSLDASMDEREDRRWREAYASRVEAKKKRWDAWDAAAEEEHARRESAARLRAREKARTSGRTPDKRRLKLDAYRTLSRAADEAYGGKVRRRRDARERRVADPAEYWDPGPRRNVRGGAAASSSESSRYARGDAFDGRREKLSADAALDWLFTPLTRAARGVDEWLNEDIRVTQGRGYDDESFDETRFLRAAAFDDRRAFDDDFTTRNPSGPSYRRDDTYGAYRRVDGTEGRRRVPRASGVYGERDSEDEYYDEYYDGSRRRGGDSSSSRVNARDWFRGLGDRFSGAPEDAPIDAREFERLRNRR